MIFVVSGLSHSVDVTRGMSLFSTHALSMVTFPTVSDISVRSFRIGVSLSRYVMKAFVISMEIFVIENNVTYVYIIKNLAWMLYGHALLTFKYFREFLLLMSIHTFILNFTSLNSILSSRPFHIFLLTVSYIICVYYIPFIYMIINQQPLLSTLMF